MKNDKDLEIFESTKAEEWKNPIKAVLGGFPGVAELYDHIYLEPLEKRRLEVIKQMCINLHKLVENVDGLTPEKLAKDPAFTTAMANAIFIAARNHEKEKLDALRNAVLNTALPERPDENLITIFLNLIDTFTPWHLRVLAFFEDPMQNLKAHEIELPKDWMNQPLWGYAIRIYLELKEDQEFFEFILQDLVARRLLKETYKRQTAQGAVLGPSPYLTGMGQKFLQYIRSPLPEDKNDFLS